MSIAKGTAIGFGVGMVAAVALSRVKVTVPHWALSAKRKQEILEWKERDARVRNTYEDREMLFDIFLAPDDMRTGLLELIRLKALIDPRWAAVLPIYENLDL